MTRDDAINELKFAIDLIKQDGKDWLDERDIPLLQMAIEALERPIPKPHDRLMYWETARRIIDSPRSKSQMLAVLDSVPPVEALERKRGEWVETSESIGWEEVECAECSVCGKTLVLGDYTMDDIKFDYNFCPNCGADMRGDVDER